MLRAWLALIAALLLTACVSTQELADALARHHHVSGIVAKIGYPTAVVPYGEDGKLYVWEHQGTISIPTSDTTYHTGTVYDPWSMNYYTYTGSSTSYGSRSIPVGCRIVVEVDANDRVQYATVQGSSCARYRNVIPQQRK